MTTNNHTNKDYCNHRLPGLPDQTYKLMSPTNLSISKWAFKNGPLLQIDDHLRCPRRCPPTAAVQLIAVAHMSMIMSTRRA